MKTADLVKALAAYDGRPLTIMEVCGTHTAAISECGIPSLLPPTIRLISGPGCPVCVTVSAYIDRLIELATSPKTCVVSFGDLLRVKGSRGDLRSTKGARVEMVYTPFRALELAESNPDTTFVFAAVGFETTAPLYALLVEQIVERGIPNLKLLTALKTMPAVIRTLCKEDNTGGNACTADFVSTIDGFIAPGHVATVTGSALFGELAQEVGKPFAVAGFTAPSLLAAILALTKSVGESIHTYPQLPIAKENEGEEPLAAERGKKTSAFEMVSSPSPGHRSERIIGGSLFNFYPSAVTAEGNREALAKVDRYFEPCTASWRGLGTIPHSGLRLREAFAHLDAGSDALTADHIPAGCHCGQVIAGKCAPADCPMFGKACTPESPIGACMVSMEGACYHHYINDRH